METKKQIPLLVIMLVLIAPCALSQNFRIQPNGKITSTDKFVIKRSYAYVYDVDFEKREASFDSDFITAFQLNSLGTGKMVISMENTDKIYLDIESCYQKKYRNSSGKYWEFRGKHKNGQIEYFYLNISSRGQIGEFWFSIGNNKRIYFYNVW